MPINIIESRNKVRGLRHDSAAGVQSSSRPAAARRSGGAAHHTGQRNDLKESRATLLFIRCSGGCERDGPVKLAH